MRRRRIVVSLLVLLSLAASLILLGGPFTRFRPVEAYGLPDLELRLSRDAADRDPFSPGYQITYQMRVGNWSMQTATDLRVQVTLPANAAYVSSSAPGLVLIQAGPDEIIWYKSHMSAFEAAWLSFTVRVNADAPPRAAAETVARVLCLESEVNYDNNNASIIEYVLPGKADLQLTKHLWQKSSSLAAGNEIIYEIAVQNLGGTAAHSVRITDTLPADCSYLSDNTADSGFATAQTGQTVVWTKSALDPAKDSADSELLYIHCQLDPGWTEDQWLENVIEASTTDPESSYDNNRIRWTYKPEEDRGYAAAVTSVDDRTMQLLSDGGFDYALFYLKWADAEPADNAFDWSILDGAVWQAWRHNLRLVVRVDRSPGWALGTGSDTAPPGNPAKLGEFLQAAAARWPRLPGNPDRPQVYGWVIWNEPNLAAEWGGNDPDAVAYTALLQAAYNGVKAGSADAWVISAGLAPTGDVPSQAVSDLDYLAAMYAAGAGSTFDYLGANAMGFAYAPDDASDPNGLNFSRAGAWRAIMEDNGDTAKRIFGTETGWLRDSPHDLGSTYNWMKVSGVDQAHYLARAYHKAQCDWGDWMGPLTTWNLDFATGDYEASDHPTWFSLVAEDGQPLRSYRTLQNAARRGPADLWLTKELVEPPQPGQEFGYVIRYTNIGGQTAAGVVLTDTLPVGTEYVSDSAGGVLQTGGDQVVWSVGEVTTCTYEAITLTLRLTGGDPATALLSNRVEANAMPGEPYVDDNVATAIDPMPDLLAIEKTVKPARVGPGQTLTYTLVYSNVGDAVAAGVVISDAVPQGQIATLSYARSGPLITPSGSVSYTWQVEDLAPGDSGVITITAIVSPVVSGAHTLTNRATISTTSTDLYWPNDSSVVSCIVDGEPPLPPALASPADGAATNDDTPQLTWSASASPDAAGYLLDFDGTVQDVGPVTQYITGVLADGFYTWTVAAYDVVSNTGVYTGVWSFSVDTVLPDPPALVSPTNGITLATSTPTMTWQASPSPDVAGYWLDLDGTVQDAGLVTQTVAGSLQEGDHAWTVAAYDVAGNTGAYTDTWTFAVDTVPPAPVLLGPADGAAINDDTPALTWAACPCADVAGYLLDIDGTVQDVGNVTGVVTGVLANDTYTWTVATYDATGHTSAYTDTWSFTVDTGPPDPPVLISPADGTLTETASLTLTWQASPSADVTGYLLDFDGLAMDLGNSTQYTTGLLVEGTYTWTVAAYDDAGNTSAYTDTWSFTVDTIPPPPVLASPPDGTHTNDVTPTLAWLPSVAPDIDGYWLDLAGVGHDLGDTTQYTTPVLADGTYTWTVAATDVGGHTGAYTDTWSFTVDTVPPDPPALSGPADGIVLYTNWVTLTWGASPHPDAAGYLLDINSVVLDSGSATSTTLAALADGTYTWTVAAYDSAVNTGAYTDSWTFTVDTTPQPPPLDSPADGAIVADNTPTLAWQPSPSIDIRGYVLGWNGSLEDVGNVTQYTLPLLVDAVYTWTLAAYNGSGFFSAPAAPWTFAVDTMPPDAADLLAPADGMLTNTASLTLTWQASPSADAAGYYVDLDGIVQDVGGTTEVSTGVLAEGTYTWTVAAYDTVSNTRPYPETWAFTVDTSGPLPPTLAGPLDGTVTDTTSLTLTWGTSPSADVAGYLLDRDGLVLDVGTETQHNTGVLTDGVYTWTVAAYDVLSNTGAYTSVWWYEVDTRAPEPPSLQSPADVLRITDNTPTLVWQASPSADAVGYLLDLGGLVRDVGGVTQTTASLLADGVYTWTVAAYDVLSHTSAFTAPWSFAVDTTAPAPPPLLSPADGAVFADVTPTLTWQASPGEGVAGYVLMLGGLAQDVGDTTQSTTDVLADGTYTWTVAAYDTVGLTGSYAQAWSFTVDTESPIGEGVSPEDGATGVAIDAALVISFSRAIDPGTFAFEVSPDPGGWAAAWESGGTAVAAVGPSVVTLDHNPFGHRRTYNVTVTAASDVLGNPLAGAPYAWSFTTVPYWLYLPLVTKEIIHAPDLVVECIRATTTDVQVVLKNEGNAPVRDEFWVDLYVDPEPIPTAVNEIWPYLADEGLVWGVTTGLLPGEVLTLTVGGDYYVGEYSQVDWPLVAGTPIYVQVDSANEGTDYGTVREQHEIAGERYNNVAGPVVPAGGSDGALVGPPAPAGQEGRASSALPPRR